MSHQNQKDVGETSADSGDTPTHQELLLQVLQELDGQLVKLEYNARPMPPSERVGILLHVPAEGAIKLHVSTNSGTGHKTYLSNIRYNEIVSIAPQWNPIWRKEENG